MLEEFYNIFGPELKAVTGDPKRIEDVLVRVGLLVEPIEQVSQCCHYCFLFFLIETIVSLLVIRNWLNH